MRALLGFWLVCVVFAALWCAGCGNGGPMAPNATGCYKTTYYVGNGVYANTYTVQYTATATPLAAVPMYYCTGTVQ